MMQVIRNFVFIVFILSAITTSAQTTATAKVDTNNIFVGQAVQLEIELKQNRNQNIPWLQLPDSIGKLEIISISKIDTVQTSDAALLQRKQTITVSAYDSGFIVIPPFNFFQDGDTNKILASTNPLLISVYVVPVDTTKPIRDIRGVVEVPYTWRDYLPWILGILGIALIGAIAYYFYRKRKNRPIAILEKKIPLRPAHEIALEALSTLDAEKLWQQGNFKSYHTQLSDIIRLYIENRWSVNAMEYTTDEILQHSFFTQLSNASREQLSMLLKLADMAKFAKAQPLANENEQSMRTAFEFVNISKQPIDLKTEELKEEVKSA